MPSPTPTPVPPKEFTVCQAEEPNTLFIYGGPSHAARNVLEAIYDGPIDTQTYQSQPVILEKLPSLADGDAELRTVEVTEGASVVDVEGLVVDLAPGVTVLRADGQEVTFEVCYDELPADVAARYVGECVLGPPELPMLFQVPVEVAVGE